MCSKLALHLLQPLALDNKLSLYSEEKNEVRFESYLDLIKNVETRVVVTKIRISCHLLSIESGRYKKIRRVERLCPLVIDPKLVMNSTIC